MTQNTETPVALVTGSSRGIGRAVAVELARAGYDLAVHCRGNTAGARETAGEIEKLGRRATVTEADLGDLESVAKLAGEVRKAHGRIDLLVNNAGAAPRVRADLLEMTPQAFDDTLRSNLRGPLFLTQAIANWMLEIRKAHAERRLSIINISSISEYAPTTTRGSYCIAKAGQGMLTKLFALRLADANIRVNEIRPGIIDTDMTAPVREKYDRCIAEGLALLRRWGQPEDVARAVRAVASADFDFATAAAFDLDGGFHLKVL